MSLSARNQRHSLSFGVSLSLQRRNLSRHCTDRSGDPVNKEEMWKGPYTRDDGVKCYSGLGGWDGIKADAGKGCVWAYSYEECTGKFTKIDLGITGQSFSSRPCRRSHKQRPKAINIISPMMMRDFPCRFNSFP